MKEKAKIRTQPSQEERSTEEATPNPPSLRSAVRVDSRKTNYNFHKENL